ncbi:MAG: Tfp pilus assembly protein FimT/FimU [Gemmatimonadales bacterium]
MKRGATLVELMVTLLLIGVLTGLGAATLGARRPTQRSLRDQAFDRGRLDAARSGRAVRVTAAGSEAYFLPDGRAVGAGLDYLTGEVIDADR